tara:strand:+ start:2486 stop:4369 length:1884 start_codon:yes stop_codon:yes gene_type:complete
MKEVYNIKNIDLYPHNQVAYNRIKKGFLNSNKLCVIQPTGTGKSFITAKLIADNPNNTFLVITSSNYIINQFLGIFDCLEDVFFIPYSTLLSNSFHTIINKKYDYIILDEFHRAGAEQWGGKVLDILKQNKRSKVLGLTATHVRNDFNETGEFKNMADILFDNNIVHHLSLRECFDVGILPAPFYITALYDLNKEYKKALEKIDHLPNRKKDSLKMAMLEKKLQWEQSHGVPTILYKYVDSQRNFLVFCRSIKHLEKVKKQVEGWFFEAFKMKVNSYVVYSEYKDSEKNINDFICNVSKEKEVFNLLFSINQFNEGIHIPNIDGVLFLRPTDSHIVYFQQLGRSLETKGVRPLVFDLVNNFKSNSHLKELHKSKFEKVFNSKELKDHYLVNKYEFVVMDEVISYQNLFKNEITFASDAFLNATNMLQSIRSSLAKKKELDREQQRFLSIVKTGKVRSNGKFLYPYEINLLAEQLEKDFGFRYRCHNNISYFYFYILDLCSNYNNYQSLPSKDKQKISHFATGYFKRIHRPYLDNIFYKDIFSYIKNNLGKDLLVRGIKKSFYDYYNDIITLAETKNDLTSDLQKWISYKWYHPETLSKREANLLIDTIRKYYFGYYQKHEEKFERLL